MTVLVLKRGRKEKFTLIESVLLIFIIIGLISYLIFFCFGNPLGSSIAFFISVAIVIGLGFYRKTEKQIYRSFKETIKPNSDIKTIKFIILLKKYNINYQDEEQLDNLIELTQKKKSSVDIWTGLKNAINGMGLYILVPLITIFLTEYLKDVGPLIMLERVAVILIMATVIVLFVTSLNDLLSLIFEPDLWKIDYLIQDIEDLKVFNKKVDRLMTKRIADSD